MSNARDVLLVVDAQTRLPLSGRALREFDVLRELLHADVIDRDDVDAHPVGRVLRRLWGWPAGLSFLAVLRASRYRNVHCDAESYGLLLGLLAHVLRWRTDVTVMLHNPDHPAKRFLLARAAAHRGLAALFVNGSSLGRRVHQEFGVPEAKVHLVPMAVDPAYWTPSAPVIGQPPYICSAGREFRDYATLVAAAEGLPVVVRIAAGSPYSRRPVALDTMALPPNVERVDCDTAGLRDLYAGAALVVVPLFNVDSVAGVTTIAEAMAMGKCVVTTRSAGQADTVADRRDHLRQGEPAMPTRGRMAALVDAEDDDLGGPTGMYVAPGDVDELRRAILYLLAHPEVREDLGTRGRRVAERVLDVRQVASMTATAIRIAGRGSCRD